MAIRQGLAPDGGLYVPEYLPALSIDAWPQHASLPRIGEVLLGPFFDGDPLQSGLRAMLEEALDFGAPLVDVTRAPGPLCALELFHGPTAAFKDFGARFLASALSRMPADDERRRSTTGRGSTWSCCIRAGSCRRGRRSSSRAGAGTCTRLPSTACSTTASASSSSPLPTRR
jgi:hypothetical protein